MRVLVAHNLYRSSAPSGENQLVRAEIGLLRDGGVDVVEMLEDSDTIPGGPAGVLRAAPGPIYSPSGVRRFERLLVSTRPDVVHLHQVQPLISPWVVRVAGKHGVPVVQTVHNYRHGCANGLHLRDGRVCTDCVGTRLGLPAVQHGCYRDSRLQTLPVSIGMVAHRRTWQDGVARYLALTPFMRDMLISYGLPADRITVRPTWVPDPGFAGEPGRDVLYVGRLDEAKGIDRLLDAWALARRSGLDPRAAPGRRGRRTPARPRESRRRRPTRRSPGSARSPPSASRRRWPKRRTSSSRPASSRGTRSPSPRRSAAAVRVLTVSGGSVGTIVDAETGWVVDPSAESAGCGTRLDLT